MAKAPQNIARSSKPVFDLVEHFPEEIVVMISKYLNASDLLILRTLSKAWRSIWSNNFIFSCIIRDQFRISHETQKEIRDTPKAFLALLHEHHRIQKSRYHSMAIYSYENETPGETEYHNGRVAWSSPPGVKVATLATGTIKNYLTMDNSRVSQFWLFEEVLVLLQGSEKLCIWSLNTDTISTTQIPSFPRHIAYGPNGLSIIIDCDIIIWPVNGIDGWTAKSENILEGSIFHPTLSDTVLVVSRIPMSSEYGIIQRVQVGEYINGIIGNIYSFDISCIGDWWYNALIFDFRPIDKNGTYAICWIFDDETDLTNIAHACQLKLQPRELFHHLLCYNIFHKEFEVKCFAKGLNNDNGTQLFRAMDWFMNHYHVWADRLLTPVLSARLGSRQFLFQTILALDQVSADPPAICYINGIGDHKAIACNDLLANKQSRDNGLLSYSTYTSELSRENQLPIEDDIYRTIRGDSKYLILLAENCYIVWCLENTIDLPLVNQVSKEWLAYNYADSVLRDAHTGP